MLPVTEACRVSACSETRFHCKPDTACVSRAKISSYDLTVPPAAPEPLWGVSTIRLLL